jgi:hypothetical protein
MRHWMPFGSSAVCSIAWAAPDTPPIMVCETSFPLVRAVHGNGLRAVSAGSNPVGGTKFEQNF